MAQSSLSHNNWNGIKPAENEYGSYYHTYVKKVGAGNIIDILINQRHQTYTLINSLTYEESAHRYQPGKWSVKEVFGHLLDTERIFAYRALRFSRGDENKLPGFDQDDYVQNANFDERSLQNLGNEYFALRNSNIHLFNSFSKEMLLRKGVASDTDFTTRSIPFIIAGHERHHLDILKTKYNVG